MRTVTVLQLLCGVILLTVLPAAAEDFETFLEPNQTVDMAALQRDRIIEFHVSDGQQVEKGQLLAIFDDRVLKAQLKLLQTAAAFRGSVDSARALVALRHSRISTLEKLQAAGNVRPLEMENSRTELTIAEARLEEEREKIKYKEAEQQVILAQIEQKKLYSPFKGVVTRIFKSEGALVSGVSTEPILTVVQLDPLIAEFHLQPFYAAQLQKDTSVLLHKGQETIEAQVTFISPVIDSQSGTIAVRMEIPNRQGLLLSGDRISYKPVHQLESN